MVLKKKKTNCRAFQVYKKLDGAKFSAFPLLEFVKIAKYGSQQT